jgi:hypothetical protein
MKKYKVNRLYQGYASIRDYVVHTCIADQSPLEVHFNALTMTLSPQDLVMKRKQFNKRKFISQYQGYYSLYDYKFVSDREVKKEEQQVFQESLTETQGETHRSF